MGLFNIYSDISSFAPRKLLIDNLPLYGVHQEKRTQVVNNSKVWDSTTRTDYQILTCTGIFIQN